MKPIIGIFPSYNLEKKEIFIDNYYAEEITDSGAEPVILPIDSTEKMLEAFSKINGLLLSGGVDIDPKYYGEANNGKSVEICPLMDETEELLIKIAMKADMPILGICRGMQALNVFNGGSLIQDLPSEHGYSVVHSLSAKEPAFHNITVEKGSLLSEAIGFGAHRVNSYHHQAVKELAPGFSVAAVAEDGVIESIYCRDKKYVLGVQWHPERDYHTVPDSKKIIDNFVKVCSEAEK